MTKYIFITGGVVSSLGKGLTCASIGMLLEHRGLTVRLQKLDPYLNVDPGLFSPAQHGEVYVLDDGSTTDLDLGHYERFTNTPLTWNSSWTTGQIYQRVFEKERHGEYQGTTVQVIPHVTNEIKQCIGRLGGHGIDVVIIEIGGTVGDIESLPHMEAIRQFPLDVGKENCLYIHLTLIPFLKAARELKTKPTQHSVGQLRQIGIQPDILICRTEVPLSHDERAKIGLFCNINTEAVIEEKDKDFSIYEVPVRLHDHKLDQLIVDKLRIHNAGALELDDWHELLERIRNPVQEVTVAVVGEYAETQDAYKSTEEALDHAGIAHRTRVNKLRIPSRYVSKNETCRELRKADAIIVSGSFGETEIEGKIETIRIARENGIPFLGIGLGMQCAMIEFSRNVLNLEGANSTEYDKNTPHPIICLREEHRFGEQYFDGHDSFAPSAGSLKTGADTIVFQLPSRISDAYGNRPLTSERFRHRYEFNNHYRDQWERSVMKISAQSADGLWVQAVEIPEHPWFVAVQFYPEFKSQPTKPHPLFSALIAAAVRKKELIVTT
ncbi:MAG: CTP synthase [Planctomycetaceae bacterium]|jgi:CTP synthase|nr:CTP synthase [Planctomycetaceae bacterium]